MCVTCAAARMNGKWNGQHLAVFLILTMDGTDYASSFKSVGSPLLNDALSTVAEHVLLSFHTFFFGKKQVRGHWEHLGTLENSIVNTCSPIRS